MTDHPRAAPRISRLEIGRRLFASFVLAAVVPIVAAMLFAYWQVAAHLQTQSEQHLRRASKAVGFELLDRLQAVEWALSQYADAGVLASHGRHIAALLAVDGAGVVTAIQGDPRPFEPLSARQRDGVAERGILLRVVAGPSATLEVLRRANGDDAPLLVAQIDSAAFFDVQDHAVLPQDTSVCVTQGAVPLHCEGRLPPDMPERGFFQYEADGDAQFAHAHPLFLQAAFQSPSWTILLAEPRARALAAATGFQRVFPLAGLLSLILVSLFSVRQIRARLEPLQALKRGTMRIAAQDFDARVDLASGDEFEEVADAFNLMAQRLHHQFESLSTLIEIDRAILEANDAPALLRTILADLPRVCPCDAVMVARFGPERCQTVTSAVGGVGSPDAAECASGPPPDHRHRLQRGDWVDVDLKEDRATYLAPLRDLGMRRARVLPMMLRGELTGAVALAWWSDASSEVDDDVVYARRVADQAAVALDSANAHEANRTLAYFDPLTDLPNRLLFRERLDQAILRAARTRAQVGVGLFDLDGFKRINDSLGHGAGDRLLQLVGERVHKLLRHSELARFGGDEFTILFADTVGVQPVAREVERLLAEIAKPFDLDGRDVSVTASVGIAIYPEDGSDPETLLKSADVAMYHAKEAGRNRYQFFSEAMTVAVVARMQLEQDLRHAMDAGELRLLYQPIFSAPDRRLVGAEALMRWEHPELGMIPPAEFIPIAEEAGLIVAMGDWALREAALQARRWQQAGTPLSVSVNISPRQFRDESLVANVCSAVQRCGIDATHLTLEITEGLLMSNEEWAVGKLAELKRMGVKLAIDDFGTGYSSFSYLKHFPVDSLKLDRCFVRDVESNAEDAAITRAIVDLGHSLGMQVVAEGVETEGQEHFLVEVGCDRLQGYRLGEPQDAEAIDTASARGRMPVGPRAPRLRTQKGEKLLE